MELEIIYSKINYENLKIIKQIIIHTFIPHYSLTLYNPISAEYNFLLAGRLRYSHYTILLKPFEIILLSKTFYMLVTFNVM